ncbi:threonine-phosphate decarboxylase CobD [Terasakiella sp. A23]|uniref:threonine-phosphate decarboxylase CobD n=1 Tax=Terasakiella sp. FCG-A23 TaxID=3080561 RepID=UPI002952B6CC|nr:threonine-phosphate decarboxylase CobD [Terasakiella sp. A23]MDV7338548.1 threonine-phosphate decarboxylase CobD [Terasakiella sp. A23]
MAVFHGGNLADAAEKFGTPVDGWVDLSTGINPNPYPIPPLKTDLWGRLPDQDLLEELKIAAASYYNVADPSLVIPVSGTQTLLQILPHVFERPKKVRILEPTYKEHAYCWDLAGHEVEGVPDLQTAEKDGDIIIVVSPNNPTGEIYSPDELIQLAKRQHAKGGLLIVDAAFVDCTPEIDVSASSGMDGLLVLRSFGKFFGLAGLRLGFVLVGGVLGQRLKDGIGPWAVNGPALEIGQRAFRDTAWIDQTRLDLAAQTARLDKVLQVAGLKVCGGTNLFRYCSISNAQELYAYLAINGILVRPFVDQPEFLRFGLPGEEKAWERLETVLKSFKV